MSHKYIYQTCEHHEDCDWTKPQNEAADSNANYIEHILRDLGSQYEQAIGKHSVKIEGYEQHSGGTSGKA